MNYQTVWKSRQFKIAACFVFAVQIFELLVFPEYRNYVSNEYGYTGLNWASSKYYAAFYLVYLFSSAVFILFVYLALRSSRVLQPFYAFIYGLINL